MTCLVITTVQCQPYPALSRVLLRAQLIFLIARIKVSAGSLCFIFWTFRLIQQRYQGGLPVSPGSTLYRIYTAAHRSARNDQLFYKRFKTNSYLGYFRCECQTWCSGQHYLLERIKSMYRNQSTQLTRNDIPFKIFAQIETSPVSTLHPSDISLVEKSILRAGGEHEMF